MQSCAPTDSVWHELCITTSMQNFKSVSAVIEHAATILERSNQVLAQVAQHPRNASTREGLFALSMARERHQLARQLFEYVNCAAEGAESFVQYTPEDGAFIEDELQGMTHLSALIERLYEIDRAFQTSFEKMSSTDLPPAANEICERTADAFRSHLQTCRMMEQTAQDM